MKRWFIMLGGVLLLVLIVGGIKALQIKKMVAGFEAMGEPKSTVSTVKIAATDWQPALTAVGSLRAVRGVDIAAEVAGRVSSVNLRSGSEVSAGTILVQQDTSADAARLAALDAEAQLARSVATRAVQQLAIEGISQAQAEGDRARAASAAAAAAEQRAIVAKKRISAPFSGRLGISTVNAGQYLNVGQTVVTLQQLDPIHVDFTLPQSALAQISQGQAVTASTDAYPTLSFKGEITAVNPVVDAETRNVRVQATLKNPQRKLLPGMFANVKVTSGGVQKLLTLPQNAVAFNPYGETVFVVVPRGSENAADPNKPAALIQSEALQKADADRKAAEAAAGKKAEQKPAAAPAAGAAPQLVARQVFITTGATRGDQVAILKGLKEGDEVVTSGQLKLKNGSLVIVNNTVQPGSNPDPRPVDE